MFLALKRNKIAGAVIKHFDIYRITQLTLIRTEKLITRISLQTTMWSWTTSSTPWKAAKSGKANLIKQSFRFLKDLILPLVNCTWCFTHDKIVEFCIQKVLRSPLRTNQYFASPTSRSTSSFVEKTTDRNPKLSSACSSLSKETLKFLSIGFYTYFKTNGSVTNHCTYQWWQLLQAARHAYTPIMIKRSQIDEFLSPFNQWEFSVSGETGNSLSSKHVYSPSINILILTSHPLESSFWAGVQFSRNPIRGFNNWKKRDMKIEGCEQSALKQLSVYMSAPAIITCMPLFAKNFSLMLVCYKILNIPHGVHLCW